MKIWGSEIWAVERVFQGLKAKLVDGPCVAGRCAQLLLFVLQSLRHFQTFRSTKKTTLRGKTLSPYYDKSLRRIS